MNDIKDRSKNPGYSRFTQQLFMSQLPSQEFSMFQEKIFRFPGFYVQRRSIRQYQYPYAAHVLGDVGEVSPSDIEDDDYYQPGDYIGKLGIEKYYEKELRGEKVCRYCCATRVAAFRENTKMASMTVSRWLVRT